MAQLAIKGHATRGNEVIKILEMLGGKNIYKLDGKKDLWYILSNSTIEHAIYCFDERSFTLEEFEEKFPYKVGDDVITKSNNVYKINDIMWDNKEIVYSLTDGNSITCWYNITELRPYKEENIEGVYAYNEINCYHQDFGKKVRIRLGNDFEIKVEDNITYIVKKQPQYPKTYIECCSVLGIEDDLQFVYENIDGRHINPACISHYRMRKLNLHDNFEDLITCRDAYWKIAGKQLGLDKPWGPDWDNLSTPHEFIKIYKGCFIYSSRVLVFPTEEMRDAFYENFKDLINKCKELL